MKKFIVFLSFVAAAVAQTKPCGKIFPPSKNDRITGTDDVAFYRGFPWHLALEVEGPITVWNYKCGATLFNASWAMTSARCVSDTFLNYRVVAGDFDRTLDEGTEQIIDVSTIHVHPDYDFNLPAFANNVAILRLAEPADLTNDYINTICLPPSNETSYVENPACYIAGWGSRTDTGGELSDVLASSGVDVVRTSLYCLMSVGFGFDIRPDQNCIMDHVFKDTSVCDGDFGGALSCIVDAVSYFAGTISHVTTLSCDPETPQITCQVAKYLDWIAEVVKV